MIDELKMLDNEPIEQYKKRICGCKDTYDLTWSEVADIISHNTGVTITGEACRKYYAYHKNDIIEELDDSTLDYLTIQKEKNKLRDERIQINSLIRTLSREETLKEIAEEAVATISSKKILDQPLPDVLQCLSDNSNKDKCATLIISDWHYGLVTDTYHNKYHPEIAIERINQLLAETIAFCRKEDIHHLVVLNLGDLINGIIHLPLRINSRYDVITQTFHVAETLSEFLAELCTFIPYVSYASTTDNHSRINANKKESLQIESFARVIDWYIEKRLKDIINFSVIENTLGDDIASYELCGHKIVGVHGDKDKQSSIISNLTLYAQHHWDLVLSAHMHHFSADESNNTILVCNGSLMGTDDYASSLRCNSKPSQLLIVHTPDNVVKSIHKIDLN